MHKINVINVSIVAKHNKNPSIPSKNEQAVCVKFTTILFMMFLSSLRKVTRLSIILFMKRSDKHRNTANAEKKRVQ